MQAGNSQQMRKIQIHNKADVVPLIYCRGHCIPLWAVFPSLQVVLSFACSVASLSRFPSHYLPCQLQLPEAATADYLFDRGNPSTWCAGLTAVHGTSSTTPPFEAQKGTTLPRYYNHFARITFACLDFWSARILIYLSCFGLLSEKILSYLLNFALIPRRYSFLPC